MSFDLLRFLKRVPATSLQSYFGPRLPVPVDWTLPTDRLAAAIIDAVMGLSSSERSALHSDLERVAQFDAETGHRCLRSVVRGEQALATFDSLEGIEACALHLLLADPDAFEKAAAFHYATRLRNGRDWSPLELPGKGTVRLTLTDFVIDTFRSRLEDIFKVDAGGSRRVKVETSQHQVADPSTGEPVDQVQFTVYVEQPPESVPTFGNALEIVRTTIHRLAEAALVVEPGSRSLDVVAKASAETRRAIADAFVATVVEGGAGLVPKARRPLALHRLKRPLPLPLTPSDRVRSATVETLWLLAPGKGGGTLMLEQRAQGDYDLYVAIERWFPNMRYPDRSGWRIKKAKLRVEFEPESERRRPKQVIVELTAPDRTNLRDQTRYHRLIAETLLDRWGLYEPSP
jgi:hypothetical protein